MVYVGFDLEFDDKTQNSSVKVAYELIKRVDEKRYRILLQADYKIRITVRTWGYISRPASLHVCRFDLQFSPNIKQH